jgi:hypothetical protein
VSEGWSPRTVVCTNSGKNKKILEKTADNRNDVAIMDLCSGQSIDLSINFFKGL